MRRLITISLIISVCSFSNISYAKTKWTKLINKQYGFVISHPANLKPQKKFGKTYFLSNKWSALANIKANKNKHSIVEIPITNIRYDRKTIGSSSKNFFYYYAAVRIGASSDPSDLQNCTHPPYYNQSGSTYINNVSYG